MVKIVDYSQLEQLAEPERNPGADKCLIVQPDERKILVNYREQFAQAEEMAKRLEVPGTEYTVVKCYED